MLEGSYQLGLSDLLDQNLSCYEYFHSLPENVQRRIVQRDVASLEEMQQRVEDMGRPRSGRTGTLRNAASPFRFFSRGSMSGCPKKVYPIPGNSCRKAGEFPVYYKHTMRSD